MAYKKSTSKAKSTKAAAETVEAPAAKASEECCAKCEADIKSLEKKIESLESKLKGLLDGIDAASKLKADLDEAKLKLGAEVSELKEKAKSWKEKADTNDDGKLDWEEVWTYVSERIKGKTHARAAKSLKK